MFNTFYKTMKYLILLLLLIPNFALATTYATWNPSDKDAGITLSGGNLIATNNNNVYSAVRSTIGKSSGKWYWEVVFTGINAALSGIANSTAALNTYIGADANGWSYFVSAQKYNNGTGTAYGATYATGDVIGVALDMDAGTLIFYKNNVSQGTAFTGLSGTMYAATSMNVTGESVTGNFGATTLVYSPPAGYCAGLVDTCPGGATPPTSIIGLVKAFWFW